MSILPSRGVFVLLLSLLQLDALHESGFPSGIGEAGGPAVHGPPVAQDSESLNSSWRPSDSKLDQHISVNYTLAMLDTMSTETLSLMEKRQDFLEELENQIANMKKELQGATASVELMQAHSNLLLGGLKMGGLAMSSTAVFVADSLNHALKRVIIDTGKVDIVAADLNMPVGLALSRDVGTAYVSSFANKIYKVNLATGHVSTLAGSGSATSQDGIGTEAGIHGPYGLARNSAETILYVAEYWNHRVRIIDIATGRVSTLAGSGRARRTDGIGPLASFASPSGLALTSDDKTLYVADTHNYAVRKVILATGAVTTLAGSGVVGYANGIGEEAAFSAVTGLALSANDDFLYIIDGKNHVVRELETRTGNVTTVAGTAGSRGYQDRKMIASTPADQRKGKSMSIKFDTPSAICVSPNRKVLFVADAGNDAIRLVYVSKAEENEAPTSKEAPTS